eukprot:m.350711 g.350711  ORF g.350711 m.350711 type:complete len:232 (+) comp16159_c0_seq2:277-972(+)
MGVQEANDLVRSVEQRRSIASRSSSTGVGISASVHALKDERILGVDLSSVVHTLLPSSSRTDVLSLCKDPTKIVELASMDERDKRFASVFDKAFCVDYFRVIFMRFLYGLREQRPNLLFVADGPPPVHKQLNAKAQRDGKFARAVQKITNCILDRNLGNDSPSVDASIGAACAVATHRWTKYFVDIAVTLLKERKVPVELAQCEAEQVLVRRQYSGKVYDILCKMMEITLC